MNDTKKLYRLDKGGMISGVCGGVAEYLNLDPSLVRVIWVALALAWTVGFWLYLVCAVVLPKKSDVYPGY